MEGWIRRENEIFPGDLLQFVMEEQIQYLYPGLEEEVKEDIFRKYIGILESH